MIELGQSWPVLNDGFVRYVDSMGTDDSVVQAARVSYGKGTKTPSDDRTLIRYLMRNRHCYIGDMEVLTIQGWKKWKDCLAKEKFLIPDPNTNKLSIEELQVLEFDNPGNTVYNYYNNRMSFTVTNNHRMYFKGKYSDQYKIYKIQDMPKWGHFQSGSKYNLVSSIGYKNSLFQFIGFYLGDGFKYGQRIAFRLVKKRKKVYLENLLKSLNWEFSKKTCNTRDDLTIYTIKPDDVIYKYEDKRFLGDIGNLSDSEIRGLWDGLVNSDGSLKKDRTQIEFSSKSIELIRLFELLATLQGIDAHNSKEFGNFRSTAYYGNRTTLEARQQYFSKSNYFGKVYCATSSTGLLLVRGSNDKFNFVCGNTTPFEMCELKIHVRAPIDCFRQWHRHRTASINEYSTRYSEAIDSCQTTSPDQWRLQSTTNKQGSENGDTEFPREYLSKRENQLQKSARNLYEERLQFGIAKEQARKDLPLSNYSEMYWKCNLHNILHFLRLRMDSHAQYEIRQYANIIGNEIVAKLWPFSWEAFQDYNFQSINLSRMEVEAIQLINLSKWDEYDKLLNTLSKREISELKDKLELLNIKPL